MPECKMQLAAQNTSSSETKQVYATIRKQIKWIK